MQTRYPAPERKNYALSGGTLSAVHFGLTQNPIKLVFLHANGFNGYAYKSVLEPLGVHSAALDLRGHGFSTLPTPIGTLPNWNIFRDDLIEFCDRYIDRPVIFAGHSFGAVSGILAAAALGERMSGFVGFDPVIMPPLLGLMAKTKWFRRNMARNVPIAAKAGKRRRYFDSPEAAFQNYQNRGAFKGVSDEALQDYLTGGIRPAAQGGIELCCDPLWEQTIFCAQSHKTHQALRRLPAHRHILFAGDKAPTPKSQKRHVQDVIGKNNVDILPGAGHLFPLHDTALATEALVQMLKRVSLA